MEFIQLGHTTTQTFAASRSPTLMPEDSDLSSGDERHSPDALASPNLPVRRPVQRPPRPKIFHCPHCPRSFDRPSLLGQVCESHLLEPELLQCNILNFPFCKISRPSLAACTHSHWRTT